MKIAQYELATPLALAPMAGITDKPFRILCREFGASWTVGEMISGDPTLRHTRKTLQRIDFTGEGSPVVVQIAGTDPERLAVSAQYYIDIGADVIDINMGCPAKKVCKAEAGSALMRDEKLVAHILEAVVAVSSVPVTLKTRLGWDDEHLNVLNIAHIAENSGISALAIHGRSRTQMYRGQARYDLIGEVKSRIQLPLWVNGDIDSIPKALQTLKSTGADGVMIGRAVQGQPWLFQEIANTLAGIPQATPWNIKISTVDKHLHAIYDFYGEEHGVAIARKHIARYITHLYDEATAKAFGKSVNTLTDAQSQHEYVMSYLHQHPNTSKA